MFDHACCLILENDKVLLVGNRKENAYKIKINKCMRIESSLVSSINDSFFFFFFFHIKLYNIKKDILSKLVKNELVKGLLHLALKKKVM